MDKMFEIQRNFTKKLFEEKYNIDFDDISNKDKLSFSKEYILSATKELFEVLDELPAWKTHRFSKNREDLNKDNLLEEIVDSFKFILNLMIINGFTSEEFMNKFLDKSKIVDIRYNQEKELLASANSNDKYAVFDIDGVLNNYPKCFMDFIEKEGYNYNTPEEFKSENLLAYEMLKHRYRQSGVKASIPVNTKNASLINHFKSKGYKIILLTARPYKKYSRIFNDTIEWLNKNDIYYDYIFFNENKERLLLENFKSDSIEIIIDDDINNVRLLQKYFKNVFLYMNPYNNYFNFSDIRKVYTNPNYLIK